MGCHGVLPTAAVERTCVQARTVTSFVVGPGGGGDEVTGNELFIGWLGYSTGHECSRTIDPLQGKGIKSLVIERCKQAAGTWRTIQSAATRDFQKKCAAREGSDNGGGTAPPEALAGACLRVRLS